MSLAFSKISRCLLTDCLAIERFAANSLRVWPFFAKSKSSSLRRLLSARALNTISTDTLICSQMAACQVRELNLGTLKGRGDENDCVIAVNESRSPGLSVVA